jgi:hypothetical protein
LDRGATGQAVANRAGVEHRATSSRPSSRPKHGCWRWWQRTRAPACSHQHGDGVEPSMDETREARGHQAMAAMRRTRALWLRVSDLACWASARERNGSRFWRLTTTQRIRKCIGLYLELYPVLKSFFLNLNFRILLDMCIPRVSRRIPYPAISDTGTAASAPYW